MKTRQTLLAATMVVLFGATSCSSDPKEDKITEQSLTSYYNVITDLETNAVTIEEGVSYVVRRNFDKQTAVYTIKGLRLPDGKAFPALKTQTLTWKPSGEWMNTLISSVDVTATNYADVPAITDFRFDVFDKVLDAGSGMAYTTISYTVNHRFRVNSYPKNILAWGNTVSVETTSGYHHDADGSVYVIELDPTTGLADIAINNFSVMADMNLAAVAITKIPYTFDTDGNLSMSIGSTQASIVISIDPNAVPMPVSDFSLTLKRGELNLSYTIKTDTGTYKVTCTPD